MPPQRERTRVDPVKRPRTAVYARVSRDRDNSESITSQVQRAEQRLTEYDGVYDPESDRFIDEGISGFSGATRPALERLKTAIAAGEYDLVVTRELSRLSRRAAELHGLVQTMTNRNVRLVVLNPPIDTADPASALILSIFAAMAQMESQQISDRVTSSQTALTQMGAFRGGSTPVGYVSRPQAEGHYRLEPEPREAAMIRRAVELLVSGLALKRVAETVNGEGYRSRSGGLLRASNIGKWLRNPALYGASFFRGDAVLGDDGRLVSWITEPVLTRSEWDDVQAVLARNERSGRSVTAVEAPLLARLVRCASCGGTMTGVKRQSRKHNGYYACRTRGAGQGADACREPASIAMGALDAFVEQIVVGVLERTVGPRETPREILDALDEVSAADDTVGRLRRSFEALDQDLQPHVWADTVERLEAAMQRRETVRGRYDEMVAAHARQDRALTSAREWSTLTRDERRAVLREIVAAVHVTKLPAPDGPRVRVAGRVTVDVWDGTVQRQVYPPSAAEQPAGEVV